MSILKNLRKLELTRSRYDEVLRMLELNLHKLMEKEYKEMKLKSGNVNFFYTF